VFSLNTNLILVTSHINNDPQQPIIAQRWNNNQLEDFSLPAGFVSTVLEASLSKDQRYVLIHGQTPEQWYVFDTEQQQWSSEITQNLPPELNQYDKDGNRYYQPEVYWAKNADHTLAITLRHFIPEPPHNEETKRYTYDAAMDQVAEYTLKKALPHLRVDQNRTSTIVPFGECSIAVLGTGMAPLPLFNQRWRCPDAFQVQVSPTLRVYLDDPVFGRQHLMIEDQTTGVTTTLASWFAIRYQTYSTIMPFGDSGKVLVVVNNRIGLLDPATKQFAELLELPFYGNSRLIQEDGVYTVSMIMTQ
jgi:hypothetical protein